MGVKLEGDDTQVALAGIEAFEDFLRSIGMPVTIKELGLDLTDEQIDELAWKCTFEGQRTIGSFKVLDLEDIKKIYHMCK